MNLDELRARTRERVIDAATLIDGDRWAFGFYAAGCASECGHMACVLRRMVFTGLVFNTRMKDRDSLTRDFEKLVDLAGLRGELGESRRADDASAQEFRRNWTLANQWISDVRYQDRTEIAAREMLSAVTARPGGVLEWIEKSC